MEAYTGFAEVYDTFMDDVPYREWAGYLHECLLEYGIKDGILLDLGCGTGNLTESLADLGYDMIGADASPEMLEIAVKKKEAHGCDILYLQQDIREFELYGTVRAMVSVCDCLNYILEEEELVQLFRLANNYLDPGGIFFFDFNTEYKYREILGERTIAEDRQECSFIWDNYYDETEKINEYEMTFFVREEDGRYSKYQETHFQRAYTLDQIRGLLERAGMEYVEAFDGYTKKKAHSRSERICVIAREHGKKSAAERQEGMKNDE